MECKEQPSVCGLRIRKGVLILLTYLLVLTDVDRAEGYPGRGISWAQLPWGGGWRGRGPYYSSDAQIHILHMSLHGALMLEGSPTLMWTGQENVLVEGPFVLSPHGGRALLLT